MKPGSSSAVTSYLLPKFSYINVKFVCDFTYYPNIPIRWTIVLNSKLNKQEYESKYNFSLKICPLTSKSKSNCTKITLTENFIAFHFEVDKIE